MQDWKHEDQKTWVLRDPPPTYFPDFGGAFSGFRVQKL